MYYQNYISTHYFLTTNISAFFRIHLLVDADNLLMSPADDPSMSSADDLPMMPWGVR